MAGIVFQCSACSHSISSDDSLCGEITNCTECGADVLVPIPGLESGAVCGDFKLLERLGAGAMGEVWLAEQTSMERKVALKVLFPQLASDKRFVARFLKEAKNSAKLAHPNIVTAFHAGVDRGIYYLAISFVSGDTIESALDNAQVYEEKEALRIVRDIALALEYAWGEFKILHRDIKPANIIIDKKGVPMLLDMGISKSLDEDSTLTMTGTVVGTPYYMSPEQAIASEDVDFRSDIYSLGTTLYHMLTGSVPFQAGTAMAIIMRHLHDDLPPPRERNSEITENCDTLLHVMMAKKREQRPQSWTALVNDISEVMAGRPPLTHVSSDATTGENAATNVSTKKGGIARKSSEKKDGAPSKAKGIIIVAALVAVFIGTAGIGFLAFNYLTSTDKTSADSSGGAVATQAAADYAAASASETPEQSTDSSTTETTRDVYGPTIPQVDDSSFSTMSQNAGHEESAAATTSVDESAATANKRSEAVAVPETKVAEPPAAIAKPKGIEADAPVKPVEKSEVAAPKPTEDENAKTAGGATKTVSAENASSATSKTAEIATKTVAKTPIPEKKPEKAVKATPTTVTPAPRESIVAGPDQQSGNSDAQGGTSG
ncbi:MAG: protein kinase, partial [Victivallales bacterium]|nr:protein kinase [Victivallales bacterium]